MIPKPDKDTTKKRNLQANITDEDRSKNPQENTSNLLLLVFYSNNNV